METPAPEQADGLHLQQDISHGLPSAFELSRKLRDAPCNGSALDALHMPFNKPNWYGINSGNKAVFQDPAPQNDQVQPDDAFSNTTVTLSYVNRSHIFSPHQSIGQLSPLCAPTVNGKLHAAPYEPNMPVSPQYEVPGRDQWDTNRGIWKDVSAYESVPSSSQPGLALAESSVPTTCQKESDRALHRLEESVCQNGTASATLCDHAGLQQNNGHNHCENNSPLDEDEGDHMQNGAGDSVAEPWLDKATLNETASAPASVGSSNPHGSLDAEDLGDGENISSLNDVESPVNGEYGTLIAKEFPVPTTSDDENGISSGFTRTLNSLSPKDEFDDVEAGAASTHETEPHIEEQGNIPVAESCSPVLGDGARPLEVAGSDLSVKDIDKCDHASVSSPMADSPVAASDQTDLLNGLPQESIATDGQSSASQDHEAKNCGSFTLNGKGRSQERALERKILPPRPRRGMRLEEIVQNITPSRHKACSVGSSSSNKGKISEPQIPARCPESEMTFSVQELPSFDAAVCREERPPENPSSSSESEVLAEARLLRSKPHNSDENDPKPFRGTVISKPIVSTLKGFRQKRAVCFRVHPSAPEPVKKVLRSPCEPEPIKKVLRSPCEPEPVPVKKVLRSTCEPEPVKKVLRSTCEPEPVKKILRSTAQPKPCTQSAISQQKNVSHQAVPVGPKKPGQKTRKRKKFQTGQSAVFVSKEPEIKLKYVNYKEEKRDNRVDTFVPYVRVEMNKYSTCTVINYPEEEKTKLKKGKSTFSGCQAYSSGQVPTTSCLVLGRLSTESRRRSHLTCCLCRRSANAKDLGDLHGPYYPDGSKPSAKTCHDVRTLKDDLGVDDSDSPFTVRGRRQHQAAAAAATTAEPLGRSTRHGQSATMEAALPGLRCRRSSERDCKKGSPAAKKPKSDSSSDDWFGPPLVPLDDCEYWVHEDCAIWCAGVYLVKGKLYGLEEATKLAQETVCTSCHKSGATIGCYFKGCPNKYHYTCAFLSDCALDEDNFSMRCAKHKSKMSKGPGTLDRGKNR
ncbi:transcription factor 20 isoform X1 [Polypterus senegalus]|uniref:transcription factor 20 isoform X1 n=1 Tax=Polypterus senegalus TaxID=55291 RepID=UPI001966C606|nr:transcription factor 20 isoform X1 [Polypterus senegalus]XP_039595231.1 transcription factor 20 isoform X1 [Polypterus senegalus]